jgi:hypothetical protein
MNMRRSVAGAVVLAVVGLTPSPAAAIAHGEDVPDHAYRFSVRLSMTGLPDAGGGTRDSSCSGALIAPRWVITAGHCFRDAGGTRVDDAPARRTTATIGRAGLDSRSGHVVDVVGVHQADGADVALAELAAEVTDIAPLAVGTTAPEPGETLRLTGFGLTGDRPATRLQTGEFTAGAVGDTTVEVSGRSPREDTSPCRHDSGGPYFREPGDGPPELVAVVSTGPGCPHPGPDIAARTDNLTGWIDGIVRPVPVRPWALIGGAVLLVTATVLAIRRSVG